MSALRIPGPDGRIRLVVIDDGAVGRVSHTRYGLRNAVPGGQLVVGTSERDRATAAQREYRQREAERRYRENHPERVAQAQREKRARRKAA